jgi:putative holliday junction resolvase
MFRIMAIDYGLKRIGLAVSDPLRITAKGIAVLDKIELDKDINILKKYIDEYKVKHIIIGVSRKSDGTLGDVGKASMDFGEKIKKIFNIKISFVEEAMTTKDVEKNFRLLGKKLKDNKKNIDKFAAEIMLQEYLKNNE